MDTQEDSRSSSRGASCGDLLSLAAHELRTPLSVVNGYLRMLQRDDASPRSEREAKMLREAEIVCGRMADLLTEMSDLARLDAGTVLKGEEFDVFALLNEVAPTVHESSDRGIALQPRGAASGGHVRGDPDRLRGALAALLRSVLREQIAACTVVAECRIDTAGTSATSPSAAVIVIGEEGLAAGASTTTPSGFNEQRGGLGMLLPIARRIVELHGGRVWTTGLRGATVVSLPLKSA